MVVKFPLSYFPKLLNLYQISRLQKDIEKVIQSLDTNKAHGHDMISIHMFKICSNSIIKPLLIIYKKCLEKGCFPNLFPSLKKYTNHLMMATKYGVYFLIY